MRATSCAGEGSVRAETHDRRGTAGGRVWHIILKGHLDTCDGQLPTVTCDGYMRRAAPAGLLATSDAPKLFSW